MTKITKVQIRCDRCSADVDEESAVNFLFIKYQTLRSYKEERVEDEVHICAGCKDIFLMFLGEFK